MKDTFDAVPVSMTTRLKSEPELIQCRREVMSVIDEKRRLLGLLFVTKFTKE